ncbi:MAG: hypothetical protein HWN81_09035 [Candidatus Lokiarchaeota archaeon]|nr:hypothetical protein [Candidatus Lokiarchaeota archaeon]
MSEENIRGQISAKEDEVTRIEEEASKEEASAESEVEAEYNPKITKAEAKLNEEEVLRDEAIEKAAEWNAKMKEKKVAAKDASKTLNTLKSDKEKALNSKLKEIANEKKTKVKEIQGEIKVLQKQIAAIEKARAKAAKEAAGQ